MGQAILTSADFHVQGQCGEGKVQESTGLQKLGWLDASSVHDSVKPRGSGTTSQARAPYQLSEMTLEW